MVEEAAWPAFDDEVVRAMAKWPDVPQCFGWLSLDTRGRWRIQGETISHARANAFLSRHYRGDAGGRWYVQNGPQQVFVDLDYTPWVYRLEPARGFVTHTGLVCATLTDALQDDDGNLLVATSLGVGVIDDRDLAACEALLEVTGDTAHTLRWHDSRLPVRRIARAAVSAAFGFEPLPR